VLCPAVSPLAAPVPALGDCAFGADGAP